MSPAQVDPDEAREQARDILGQRRYRSAEVPKPFEGALEWLGGRLRPISEFFDAVLSSNAGRVLLAIVVAGLAALLAVFLARRRRGERVVSTRRRRGQVGVDDSLDPAELEGAADQAERSGDLDRAVRLRFRAGLLRLDAAGAIRFRPSITTGQVARRLRRPAYDDLAITFDQVAYGGRRASPADVHAARETWSRLLADVRMRR